MSTESFHAIGIDVGGTKIAGALVRFPEAKIFFRQIIPTARNREHNVILNDVVRLTEELASEAKAQAISLQGIGVGLCELVDLQGHIFSGHSLELKEELLVEHLSPIAPVVLEADVRAAALAEAMFGAGRSLRVFLYVTIGTGISSCLVLDGEPFVGAHGATGTMASGPIERECSHCGHVSRDTLEEEASGPALVKRFNQQRSGAAQTGHDVLAAAARGDATAVKVLGSAGQFVGSTVALLVNVLDPEAVIVGGGLGLAQGLYWESFVQNVRQGIYSDLHRNIPILHATTGENAGLIGAAATLWKKFGSRFKS